MSGKKYTLIKDETLNADSSSETNKSVDKSKTKRIGTTVLLLSISFAAGLLSLLLLQAMQSRRAEDIHWTHCGQSPEDARLRGCIYEPMQRSWIPPECHFSEPGEEYDPFGDRQWFQDENLTKPATDEDLEKLRRGDYFTAYTRYFHDEHCLYLWRKLAIAMEKGLTLIDSKTANVGHAAHCSKYIAKKLVEAESDNATFPFPGFPDHSKSPIMMSTCVPVYNKIARRHS